jgi:hypothetical protein
MMKNKSLISIIAFIFIVSFWSCQSPAGPENPIKKSVELWVISSPWHAFIWLDGGDTGYRTNAIIPGVELGTHTVLLLKPGFQNWEKTFTITNKHLEWGRYTIDAKLWALDITVTEPTSDTVWIKGKEAVISWEPEHEPPGSASNNKEADSLTSSGSVEANAQNVMRPLYLPNVKIYLYKGDTEVMTIVGEIENTGSYTWTVDPSLEDGTDYKVRVTSSWETPEISKVYGESEAFTIK